MFAALWRVGIYVGVSNLPGLCRCTHCQDRRRLYRGHEAYYRAPIVFRTESFTRRRRVNQDFIAEYQAAASLGREFDHTGLLLISFDARPTQRRWMNRAK